MSPDDGPPLVGKREDIVAKLDLKTTSMIQLVLQVNGRARPDDLQGMSAEAASEALHAYHALHSTTEPMYFEGAELVMGPAAPAAGGQFAAPRPAAGDFGAPVTDFGMASAAAPVVNIPEVFPTAPVGPGIDAPQATPGIVDFGMPAPSGAPVADFGAPAAPAPTGFGEPAGSFGAPAGPDFGVPAPVPSSFEVPPAPAPAPAPSFDFSEIPPAAPVAEPADESKSSSGRLLLLLVLLVVVLLAAVIALGWAGIIDLPFGLFGTEQGAAPVKPVTIPAAVAPGGQAASASIPATK